MSFVEKEALCVRARIVRQYLLNFITVLFYSSFRSHTQQGKK